MSVLLRLDFPTYTLESRTWIVTIFVSSAKTILTPLEPPVTIEHRLEPLFYAEASALVGPSISGVICLKKARMSPYAGTNSNPSCVGTSGILELL